jgi:uncharacterized protein (DUF608 family)
MPDDSQGIPRRQFLRMSGAAAAGLTMGRLPFAKYVPLQKTLPAWAESVQSPGARSVFFGKDLRFIGMPVGGICAGQVYLGGDGRLWLWDVFNEIKEGILPRRVPFRGETFGPGGGANYIDPPQQTHPFEQGFAISIGSEERRMDSSGWKDISFTGEYPLGMVRYRDPGSKIEVDLTAFSPFIPLDPDESGLPLTIMRFTVRNRSTESVKVSIAGWMENAPLKRIGTTAKAVGEQRVVRDNGFTSIEFAAKEPPSTGPVPRPDVLFEDFEKERYEGWTATGTAFGDGTRDRATLPAYVGNVGGEGQRVVNTHHTQQGEDVVQADSHVGRLTSDPFTIPRRFIEFYLGGGNHPGKTCVNLLVGGQVVRTVTGRNDNRMRLEHFEVADLEGQQARIEVVDEERGGWGQISIDHIVFTDAPRGAKLIDRPDYGEMALVLLGRTDKDWVNSGLEPSAVFTVSDPNNPPTAVLRDLTLAAGQEETVSFAVAWRFPNLILNGLGKVGHFYAVRFATVGEVVRHLAENYDRLYKSTRKWHDAWYGSTLPHWLLERTMANAATLATMTCVRFSNGRFYGWEGIGCCDGTCGHVWQYAQSVGRLFPSLERSVREMVDYGVAFHEDTGLIDFRGEYGFGFAADAQAGYVLRTLREHQTSPDDGFLKRVYPRAKKALEYLIHQDTDEDGVLEGRQHNTLDVDLYGPSSWLTSLYLAALRAGEEMAKETGDTAFAQRCRTIFDRGAGRFDEVFWDGDYYVQRLNVAEHPEALRYGTGCEADQLMGQGWAWQLGLGRIVGAVKSRQALASLYRNNFLTDVGTYRDDHKAGRWYAMPGEPGLLMCTFPKGNRAEILGEKPTWASMYFNECWTGAEYEAAGHMVAEGLVKEGLTVARAVHERHHPSKRNPYNEVECSDHYARCMSVHGLYLTVCGFEYHGPKGRLGFAPRVAAEDFKAAFTAAEGWGSFSQTIQSGSYRAKVRIEHGRLKLRQLSLQVPEARGTKPSVQMAGKAVQARTERTGDRLTLSFPTQLFLKEGDELVVELS